MVMVHSDGEGGKPLSPLIGLLFPVSSKGSFVYNIPQRGDHIPQPLLHQLWRTGWNEKYLLLLHGESRPWSSTSRFIQKVLNQTWCHLAVNKMCEWVIILIISFLMASYPWKHAVWGSWSQKPRYLSALWPDGTAPGKTVLFSGVCQL